MALKERLLRTFLSAVCNIQEKIALTLAQMRTGGWVEVTVDLGPPPERGQRGYQSYQQRKQWLGRQRKTILMSPDKAANMPYPGYGYVHVPPEIFDATKPEFRGRANVFGYIGLFPMIEMYSQEIKERLHTNDFHLGLASAILRRTASVSTSPAEHFVRAHVLLNLLKPYDQNPVSQSCAMITNKAHYPDQTRIDRAAATPQ